MYRHTIAQSDSGYEIYINLIASPAGRYLSRRPYLINLVKEVLLPLDLKGVRIIIERDMGRNIGTTDIVATSEKDVIYYAQPMKTATFSRFAKNRYPQPSQIFTLIVEKDDNGDYEIQDAWIGPSSPAFPGDEHESTESKLYWQTHALVQDAQAIQSRSITKDCPY